MNTEGSSSRIDAGVIETFRIKGDSGYSEYWRRDKSPVETLELAKLLTAVRKFVSHIGQNAGSVSWKETQPCDIMLDARPVRGKYPVPASKVDTLIGEAVMRALLNTEMSSYAEKLSKADLKNLNFRFMYKFDLFFKTCERVYVDGISNRKIFGIYTEKNRARQVTNSLDVTSHPPSLSELFSLWWDIAADRKNKRYLEEFKDTSARRLMNGISLEKFYKKPIRILNSMVPELFETCPQINGVSERCRFRADLYNRTWEKLFAYIKYWPVDQSDMFLQARERETHQLKGALKKKLPSELVFSEKLGKVVQKKAQAKEPDVKATVDTSIAQVVANTIVLPADNYINKKLLQDLNGVFKSVAVRKAMFNRGLKSGGIDRRRIYRAATTGLVFHTKKNEFQVLNDIVVIVDATGSMAATNKWEHTQEIFQTLFSAAKTYNRNARLFGYNEIRNRCMLTELYRKGKYYTIQPNGKTASGDVIKTLLKKIKGKHKKPIFIHITDGASNWGCPINEAIDLCRKNKVLLLTLGVNCSKENKELLKNEYGRLVQFADSAEMLPSLVRNLLIRGKRAFLN